MADAHVATTVPVEAAPGASVEMITHSSHGKLSCLSSRSLN